MQTYSLSEIKNGTGWPKGARFMLIPEFGPDGKIPEAVVVDTRDGYTWARGYSDEPFTEASAAEFARTMNDACKPEHRTLQVFKLVPVEESSVMHEHTYQGQTLRHAHPGGDLDHGYFEHPEDMHFDTVEPAIDQNSGGN